MKKFTLQLHNTNREIIEEKEVRIGENDTLIMHYPENMTIEEASRSFNFLKNGLETGETVGLVDTISFSILKKK